MGVFVLRVHWEVSDSLFLLIDPASMVTALHPVPTGSNVSDRMSPYDWMNQIGTRLASGKTLSHAFTGFLLKDVIILDLIIVPVLTLSSM